MTTAPKTTVTEKRELVQSAELPAEASTVWKALTDAEELRRWFPLDAEVEPGEGGSVTLGWGPGTAYTSKIATWRENRHLRVVTEGEGGAVMGAVDYFIEGKGGKTSLRVVTSGFDQGDDWKDFYDTMDSGWRYFLWNLRVYLERHLGTPRRMVWKRQAMTTPREAAWRGLFGEEGLVQLEKSGEPEPGDSFRLWSGARGRVHSVTPGMHFTGSIPELQDALLLVELEPGGATWHLGVWLSTYGLPAADVENLQAALDGAS